MKLVPTTKTSKHKQKWQISNVVFSKTVKGHFYKMTRSMFQSSSKLSNQLKRKVNRSGSSFSNSFQVGGRYGSPMWVHYATEERAEGRGTDGRTTRFLRDLTAAAVK